MYIVGALRTPGAAGTELCMPIRRAVALFGFVVLIAGLVGGNACSPNAPSGTLSGTWAARGMGHSLWFRLVLSQRGDTVTGTACAVSGGVLMFQGAPVHGSYPRVSFVVTPASAMPCCGHLAGASFSGRLDDTRDIVGASSFGSDLRFERGGDGAACEGSIVVR